MKVRLNEQMEEYQKNKDRFTNLSSSVRKDDAVIYGTIKSTLPSDEGDEEEPETVCLAHYNFVSTLWVSDASNPSSIWYADLHKKKQANKNNTDSQHGLKQRGVKMFYYLTEYSFDSDRPIQGPFSSYEECWEKMEKDAENELRIDTENGFNTEMKKNVEDGTIVITNSFADYDDDVTTWSILDVPAKALPEKETAAKQLLAENGVEAGKVDDVLAQLEAILFDVAPQQDGKEMHTMHRTILGDDIIVQVFGKKMRFLVSGTFYSVPEQAEELLAGNRMQLTRHPDGSATVYAQCLVAYNMSDADMDRLSEDMLNRIESVLSLSEVEHLSSSSWNAGHAEDTWDALLTDDEKNLIKEASLEGVTQG